MLGLFVFVKKGDQTYFGKVISIYSRSIRLNGIVVNTKRIDIKKLPYNFIESVKRKPITIRVEAPYEATIYSEL